MSPWVLGNLKLNVQLYILTQRLIQKATRYCPDEATILKMHLRSFHAVMWTLASVSFISWHFSWFSRGASYPQLGKECQLPSLAFPGMSKSGRQPTESEFTLEPLTFVRWSLRVGCPLTSDTNSFRHSTVECLVRYRFKVWKFIFQRLFS